VSGIVLDKVLLPDIGKEVERFLSGYDRLVRLPLISDAETERLFSPQFLQTLEQLRQYDQAERICSGCAGLCCGTIHCEVYDPAFGICPIFSLRPLLCRLHFCNKFDKYREEVKIIGDIFLESLLEIGKQGSFKANLFDSPPLAPAVPAMTGKIMPLMTAFREGRLDRSASLRAILAVAENYRIVV
jgi:hypothetical protein